MLLQSPGPYLLKTDKARAAARGQNQSGRDHYHGKERIGQRPAIYGEVSTLDRSSGNVVRPRHEVRDHGKPGHPDSEKDQTSLLSNCGIANARHGMLPSSTPPTHVRRTLEISCKAPTPCSPPPGLVSFISLFDRAIPHASVPVAPDVLLRLATSHRRRAYRASTILNTAVKPSGPSVYPHATRTISAPLGSRAYSPQLTRPHRLLLGRRPGFLHFLSPPRRSNTRDKLRGARSRTMVLQNSYTVPTSNYHAPPLLRPPLVSFIALLGGGAPCADLSTQQHRWPAQPLDAALCPRTPG